MTSRRTSTRRWGCRICTRASCSACFTVEVTAGKNGMERGHVTRGEYSRAPNTQDATWTLTGERSHHLPFQFLGHRFTELHCNLSCHVFSLEKDKSRESVLLRRLRTSHIGAKGRMESVCRIPTGPDCCPPFAALLRAPQGQDRNSPQFLWARTSQTTGTTHTGAHPAEHREPGNRH